LPVLYSNIPPFSNRQFAIIQQRSIDSVDTGIRRTHNDFGGRALVGFDSIGDGQHSNDCNGHGTHVAGTVGSATYGVAKNVTLYAVRVELPGFGVEFRRYRGCRLGNAKL